MTEPFTLSEAQHIMAMMNEGDPHCSICSSARKKLEAMIAEMSKQT
jgi:hypothetical protein